jgi:hypothetical protein
MKSKTIQTIEVDDLLQQIRELYAEFAAKSEIKQKWHSVFTTRYILEQFEAKFGKEILTPQQ